MIAENRLVFVSETPRWMGESSLYGVVPSDRFEADRMCVIDFPDRFSKSVIESLQIQRLSDPRIHKKRILEHSPSKWLIDQLVSNNVGVVFECSCNL